MIKSCWSHKDLLIKICVLWNMIKIAVKQMTILYIHNIKNETSKDYQQLSATCFSNLMVYDIKAVHTKNLFYRLSFKTFNMCQVIITLASPKQIFWDSLFVSWYFAVLCPYVKLGFCQISEVLRFKQLNLK